MTFPSLELACFLLAPPGPTNKMDYDVKPTTVYMSICLQIKMEPSISDIEAI